jgi:hypothetical protein
MLLRPAMSAPYDARWGNGSRDYSPIVVRSTVRAAQLLSGRASYVKAFIVHFRGLPANRLCANNCALVQGGREFTAFAGCVSILGV